VDSNTFIAEAYKNLPKLNAFDAKLVLSDLYETTYGIYDHINPSKGRPLASVALHESEDNTTTSNLYEAIERYHQKGIKDLFGLSITEYLDLPTEICIKLMDIATRDANDKTKIAKQIEDTMNKDK
jgi:hypothetical protein